jgi:hypothetical protein
VRVISVYIFVYYESIKREPKIRGIYECRCDERLQTKSKEFTRLANTGLFGCHASQISYFSFLPVFFFKGVDEYSLWQP